MLKLVLKSESLFNFFIFLGFIFLSLLKPQSIKVLKDLLQLIKLVTKQKKNLEIDYFFIIIITNTI